MRAQNAQLTTVLLVMIMLSALTTLFSTTAKATEMQPRRINLSGNLFEFSMPEDFSKDLPAYDMVERLDISDLSKFDNPEYGNLIRRWWDIKEPGWFGKELGTVMMDISVQRVVENKQKLLHASPYNLGDRFDFMLMVDDKFHQSYDAVNEEMGRTETGELPYHSSVITMVGDRVYLNHWECELNGQKWNRQNVAGPNGTLIFNYALPLSESIYLEASFTYAPNDNVIARHFLDTAVEKMKAVPESFRLHYAPGNGLSDVVGGKWLKQSNDDLIEQHRDEIVRLFYPDGMIKGSESLF